MECHLDFETRSDIDLRKHGLEVYVASDYTDVLCAAYAFGKGPIQLWKLGAPMPNELVDFVRNGGQLVAHNANFELAIWNNVLKIKHHWPVLNPKNIYCTMAKAYAMALPGALANVAPALGLKQIKDSKGHRIMLQLSKPRSYSDDNEPIWWNPDLAKSPKERLVIEQKYQRLYEYCIQDVAVEREVDERTLKLPPSEQKLWELDYEINQNGIPIDDISVEKSIRIIKIEKKRLDQRIRDLTGNIVSSCGEIARIKMWLESEGVTVPGLAKADVIDLLNETIPENCKEVLKLRQIAGKTSTAKLEAMVNGMGRDMRVRNTLQYHGASTGRWAGRRLQVQNFPRPTISQEDIEQIFDWLLSKSADECIELINIFYGEPLIVISDCLRGFICAPIGRELMCGDWSAIEARVIAWLAGEESALAVFRSGADIYKKEAAGIYNVSEEDVTKDQRQVGKVAVLALGYQGGKKAFQHMAKNYGVNKTDREADIIKNAWRDNNREIVKFWYALEKASYRAVNNPGTKFFAGHKDRRITYLMKGTFLLCRLPSGRVICYPYPRIEITTTPWGAEKSVVTFMCVDAITKQWVRRKSYGGYLAENVAQATARDILSDCLVRLKENGFKTIMHVHDEVVCEVSDDAFYDAKILEEIMNESPAWAKDLPLQSEAWLGGRYRK